MARKRQAALGFIICVLISKNIDCVQRLAHDHRIKRSLPAETRDILRNMSPNDRPSCKQGAVIPGNRVDTSARLQALRGQLTANSIDAYIIPSEDSHQSEYPSKYDQRRKFISGMSGSAGKAVVTGTKAALWTDGRYFLQAEDELDCNWILMKIGEIGVPTPTEWLIAEFGGGSAKVGAYPFLISSSDWVDLSKDLQKESISLTATNTDLIDKIWTTGRLSQPDTSINALPMEFAGLEWQNKTRDVYKAMEDKEADTLIVTGLDETAWLLNLRAADVLYNPFFLSYIILNKKENSIKLYIKSKDKKLTENPTDPMTKVKLYEHLNTMRTGSCVGKTDLCVTVLDYNPATVQNEVARVSQNSKLVWISYTCNYALYSQIPQDQTYQEAKNLMTRTCVGRIYNEKVFQGNTPIALQKAKKNPVERNGMKKSHIRDAVALITFLAKLEKEVKAGVHWTEVSAATELEKERRKQLYNRGLSFGSISGSGSNGAIIHYLPTNITDKAITTHDMYLLDTGGQYLDGTTDVTRTLHFGNPTEYEKECYTRVLMGHIDLADFKFVIGHIGREIDSVARRPLWDVGLEYRHGTGHGIGMYLSVHEGPAMNTRSKPAKSNGPYDEWYFTSNGQAIMTRAKPAKYDYPYDEWYFISDEPGYYEDGKFGIRLENIMMIKKVKTKYQFPNTTFLGFETITLVPYEHNLIQYDLLSQRQIDWINSYHKTVMDTVGPLLKTTHPNAYTWMERRTRPISRDTSGAANTFYSLFIISISILIPGVVYC